MELWKKITIGIAIAAVAIGLVVLLFKKTADPAPVFSNTNVLSEHELELQIPMASTTMERQLFETEVKNYIAKNKNYNLRAIYEKYIGKIGANGMIDTIQKLDPECHFEGHDLGKVIYSKVGTIGESLAVCTDACYSGCMHGVFMEAFKEKQKEKETRETKAPEDDGDGDGGEQHVGLDVVKASIPSICSDPSVASLYRLGDCAHGVGHAVMYLSGYQVKPAIDTCNLFPDKKLAYYCATGAYMEYVAVKGKTDHADATKSGIYPCDTGEYPAACFFSKIGDMLFYNQQKGGRPADIVAECLKLPEMYQLGCFHGFGNGHLEPLVLGKTKITNVCSAGDDKDKESCIDGAMMRMGKYHYDIGKKICENDLVGDQQSICLNALNQRMYGLDRPFELYLN